MSGRPLLRIQVPARAEALAAMRQALTLALERLHIAQRERERLVLAVHEACTNVIRHAYRECSGGCIGLCVERVRGQLRIRLRDRAPPVDPNCVKPRDLSECRPGGLGINIIDETMDRWRLRPLKHRAGNVLCMRRRLRKESRS
jgi:anti-sigma regulatory factor (Ser/Thr protein kinase)